MHFCYDIQSSWDANCERGPQFADPVPDVPETPLKSFLGLPVRSRLGIAAGLLPNSRWLLPYAERGFDLLTYKTVRSIRRDSYPLPNWVFVEETTPGESPVYVVDDPGSDPSRISSAVCFGMPSTEPAHWRSDVRVTRTGLKDGRILIVSVVGTPASRPSLQQIADDFAQCAAWAVESGAHVVEANLSCPNVCSPEGTIYQDPAASDAVVRAIRSRIGMTPLLLKVGVFATQQRLRQFLQTVNGIANGLTLVNCVSRPVLRRDGSPAFGPQFRSAGVLGRAIHHSCVEVVQDATQCIRKDGLNLQVAAVGGASTIGDIAEFFEAGADAVLCGSSPMYLPNLAAEAKRLHPEW